MLRKCRIIPKISAFTFLHDMHDYYAVPFAPPSESKWMMHIYKYPNKGASWDCHGVEGFSIGPAFENYWCYKGLVPPLEE